MGAISSHFSMAERIRSILVLGGEKRKREEKGDGREREEGGREEGKREVSFLKNKKK